MNADVIYNVGHVFHTFVHVPIAKIMRMACLNLLLLSDRRMEGTKVFTQWVGDMLKTAKKETSLSHWYMQHAESLDHPQDCDSSSWSSGIRHTVHFYGNMFDYQ